MTRAVPWNINGVDFDAREAAKAAARRAGMSLGEWLNGVISEEAAKLGVSFDDVDDDDRLEAVAARLATLSRRPGQSASRTRRSGRYGRETTRRAAADEDVDDLRHARAVYDDIDWRARASVDPEQLLDRAVAAFDRRTRLAHDRTSAALAKVSRRLGDIEGRLDDGALPRSEPPAKDLLSRLGAIASRLEQAETKAGAGGRPEDIVRIEAKLNRLSETIDRAARSQPRPVIARRGAFARRSVADAVAEITQRQAALDHDMRPMPAPEHGVDLRSELAVMSTRLEEMRREAAMREERQSRVIGEKIEALGAQRPDAAVLARIRAQTEEIRDLLAAAVARPMPIENIEGQITALAQRVDAIATLGATPAALAQVDAQLAEIRAALERPVGEPHFLQIEGRIESLTQKVEEALSNAAGSDHFDELTQRLDRMHQSLAARIERPAADLDTKAFEGMMRDIVGKLAAPPRAMAGAPELEGLLARLADRLDAPTPTGRLEELVRELAEKMEVAAPRSDVHALNALQDQIARLALRLDEPDANRGGFGSLERNIADLFSGLEETRRATVEAAETAARAAAHDAVREAVLAAPGEMRATSDEHADHLTRELAGLRALQDAADRQTHATLTAVHETLEKVVDRLAMLEDDIVDVRNAAFDQPSAAGPLPVFAPSPRLRGAPEIRDAPPGPRPDDRDFLIEPGTGFSPDRRPVEAPPKPPSSTDKKPPPAPPSAPSVPPPPPQAGSTQANFIAAARRTIQANAENVAVSHPRKVADADAEGEQPGKQRRSGALARASAFLTGRKRPLVLGVAGIVVVFCALELVRTRATPPMAVVDESAIPVPARAMPAYVAAPAKTAPPVFASPAPSPAFDSTSADAPQKDAAPQKISPPAAQSIDLSPLGSIAKPPASSPPILSIAPFTPPPVDTTAADLPVVRDLATHGNAAAELELGLRYAEGRGLPHDMTLAAQWLEKAAQQNNAPAQYRLATLYEKGLGVTRNATVAINWYRRAANGGNIRAMHNLAVMIAESPDGKPDYDDAAIWFRKAAEFGIRDSQYNVAILYARGLGVEKDLAQSFIWFALAAGQGDEDAAGKRDEIANHLDPKQLADAKAIVDAFKPRTAPASANNAAPPAGGWSALKAAPHAAAKPPASAKISTL